MTKKERLMTLALREAHNALFDYVDRLEKQGGMMGYGRRVIAQIEAIPGIIEKKEPEAKLPCRVCDESEPRHTSHRCSVCKAPVCEEHRSGQHCEDCNP